MSKFPRRVFLPALFGFFIAAIALFFAGGAIMVAGPFAGFPGGPLAAVLMGLGLMAGAVVVAILHLVPRKKAH